MADNPQPQLQPPLDILAQDELILTAIAAARRIFFPLAETVASTTPIIAPARGELILANLVRGLALGTLTAEGIETLITLASDEMRTRLRMAKAEAKATEAYNLRGTRPPPGDKAANTARLLAALSKDT